MKNAVRGQYFELPREDFGQEAEYQNLIRRGLKIIRLSCDPYDIEMKKKNNRGWQRIEKFTTADARMWRVFEMLQDPKTIKDI